MAFCDNDVAKQGATIDGVSVIAFDELMRVKDDVAVLVSPVEADEIYRDLAANNVPHVLPQHLSRLLYLMEGLTEEAFDGMHKFGAPYSPYADFAYFDAHKAQIFDCRKAVLDINFNLPRQMELQEEFEKFYPTLPKWARLPEASSKYRYRYGNAFLPDMDAVHLHCMLRYLRPRQLIEVGSGWTSAVTLDTNEFYLDNQIALSFIEPYPERLRSLLRATDKIDLHESLLQDMPTSYFDKLQAGDVLFVDSSHVSKVCSDVNYLFFELLPRLNSGVYIHLHDICYPFEYPLEWTRKGVAWSEQYLLRAFLQNNRDYEIQYFQDMMMNLHRERVASKWMLDREPPHGGSFWMKKL